MKKYFLCLIFMLKINAASVALLEKDMIFIALDLNLYKLDIYSLEVTKYETLINFYSITANNNQIYLLDFANNVYSMGNNNFGQLGLGDNIDREIPEKIENLSNIKTVVAGINYAYFIDFDGNVFAVGCNNHTQLGFKDYKNRNIPEKIINLVPIKNIFICNSASYFLDFFGDVYITGYADSKHISSPEKINYLTDIKNINIKGVIVSFYSDIKGLYFVFHNKINNPEKIVINYQVEDFIRYDNLSIFLDSNNSVKIINHYIKKEKCLADVKNIFSSDSYILFLSYDGEVNMYPTNCNNKIFDFNECCSFIKIEHLPAIKEIYQSIKGTLFISECDDVFIIGYDKYKKAHKLDIKVNVINKIGMKTKSANNLR